MSFLELAKKRYSARAFKNEQVDQKILDDILQAGRVAPTAANKQPQRILVIRSEEGLSKLAKAAKFYNAPTMLVICAENKQAWTREYDQKNTSDIDASIVTDHMMMAAADIGVDSGSWQPEIWKLVEW